MAAAVIVVDLAVAVLVAASAVGLAVPSAAGALAAVVICAVAYPLTPGQVVEATRQWAPVLIEVLAIVFGGLLLSEAMRRTGRQDVIASWLGRTLGTGTPAALAVLHGVTPFAESVTGFGIGVTLAIPLLLHLLSPARRPAASTPRKVRRGARGPKALFVQAEKQRGR